MNSAIFAPTHFRNDDLCWDSNIEQYKEVQSIMEEAGTKEMYSVTPFGRGLYHEDPFSMPIGELNKFLGTNPVWTNQRVDEFIKESLKRGHTISLHGWTHTRIALSSFVQQDEAIRLAKAGLEKQYGVKIEYFVPPYNNFNDDTVLICKKLGLKILAANNNQLEWLVRDNDGFTGDDFCWYHAWRFYEGDLTPIKLREYLCNQRI